ncbi:MAG: hypothetical protein IT427_00160 [Pirellulales bacterium]|nr:hypothetical protein [Pirellulales bacterium]
MIAAAISAAIASMGFTTVEEAVSASRTTSVVTNEKETIEVENSEILAGGEGLNEQTIVEKDGIRATFSRDARGALRVCMEGRGLSKQQLRELGEELIGRVTQQFVYHRIVTELKEKNMAIVGEEVTADRVVRLRVRNW